MNLKSRFLKPLLALACYSFLAGVSNADSKPNIVFFLVDDMGWQDTSVTFHSEKTQLNRDYKTPNMEKLAQSGLLFSNAHACSICSPTRVSLMTGQNAARHKVTCWTLRKNTSPEQATKTHSPSHWNLNGLQPKGANVPASVEADCLPKLLHAAGYRTIHAGKAHFGAKDTPGANPINLGFDVNIAGSYMGGPGSYHGDRNFSAAWRGGGRIWDVPGLEKYHGQKINLTEAITREVITELEKSVASKTPFYLYLAHYAVHAPFEPDRRFLPNYADKNWSKHKKTYASMLESMDHSLGDILATLERLGVADNTIVVFMSDNGSPSQNPQNKPLRGHKITAYEGGARVPMIVKWPTVTQPNTRTSTAIIIEDIFPTLLEMAGASQIPKTDGVSFTDILKKPTTSRKNRPLFWHYPNFYGPPAHSSVMLGDFKLIHWHTTGELVLYNLAKDLGEKNNIASQHPEIVKKLARILTQHLKETKASRIIDKATKLPVPYPDQVRSLKNTSTDTFHPKLKPFTPDNHFTSKDWFNWGGSIIRESDDSYYLFYSRWPKKYGFLSWLTHSEIAVAHSKTPSGPWKYQYTALTGRRGNHWDAITCHNPKIKKFGSKFYLYYISTHKDLTEKELIQTAKGGYNNKHWRPLRNAQRIGVAVSDSLQGPWKRQDQPLLNPASPAHTITVNPAIIQRADGKGYIMMFKGDKKPTRSQRVQAIATGPTPLGPFTILPDLAVADYDTEDASLWYDTTRSRYYAVFHAHDKYGFITSQDGIHWKKAQHFSMPKAFARQEKALFKANRLERPGVYTDAKGIPQVFVTSYRKGNTTGILTIPCIPPTTPNKRP